MPVIGPLLACLCFLGLISTNLSAQTSDVKWQMVMRGEGFVIDLDPESLTLSGPAMGATFRMAYAKSESIGNVMFRSRIDRYEFENGNYRIIDSRYFDSDGDEITGLSSSGPQKWKTVSGTASRLVGALTNRSPFGQWKILSYKYGDGSGPRPDDTRDVVALTNSFAFVNFSQVSAGKTRCGSPSFELGELKKNDLEKRLAISLDTIGITSGQVRTLSIRCKSSTSLMFLTSPGKATLLWDGMFLMIEREDRNGFTFNPLTIK